jgi:hypothetical protein
MDYQDVYSKHVRTNWQVSSDIFNLSLTESVRSTCFKQTTIVPVPKKMKVTCLNDCRPVALTSAAMKCFQRLVMAYINTIMSETLDPLQFAHRPNRSTDDAIPLCPHYQQTNMFQAHQDSREEGTTKPIPPQETENIWHESSDPQCSTAAPWRAS